MRTVPRGQVCALPTPDGSGECTHPSVVDSLDVLGYPWQGYRYWMAFTPYPGTDPRRFRLENPCVVVSQDASDWQVPVGVKNPLVPPPDLADFFAGLSLTTPLRRLAWQFRGTLLQRSYNADPCLYLAPDGVMYLAYVRSLKGWSHDHLVLLESSDGWRSIRRRRVLVRAHQEANTFEVDVPSIVEVDGTLHLYYGYVPSDRNGCPRYDQVGIRRRSSHTFDSLGAPRSLEIHYPAGFRLWHHELRACPDGRTICLGTFAPDVGPVDRMEWPPRLSLFDGEVDGDALTFADRPILEPSTAGWDSQCIYKPSFLFEQGNARRSLRLWYSAQDAQTMRWHIGGVDREISLDPDVEATKTVGTGDDGRDP